MTFSPRPYQRLGIEWLASNRRAYLADEPGLGKSLQAVRACDAIGATRILVVCPASVVAVWASEFRKWQTIPRKIVTVTDVRTLLRLDFEGVTICSYDRANDVRRRLSPGKVHVLVVDEAHYIKTRTAARTKCILPLKGNSLADAADFVWLLSGTPTPNNPSELWAVLRSRFPQTILNARGLPMEFWEFARRYCLVKNGAFGLVIKGGRNIDELRGRISAIFLRRRVSDVLTDLPPMLWGDLPVTAVMPAMDDPEWAGKVQAAMDAGRWREVERLATEQGSYARLIGMAKVDPVCDLLIEEMEAKAVGKVVVWAWHRDVIAAIVQRLEGYGVTQITGSSTPGQRASAVEAFQSPGGPRVLVGQIKAAGTGLTLTAACEEIFVEQSWVPADNAQAAKRCHRIGQDRPVRVRVAHVAGSIDERISTALREKSEAVEKLLDDPRVMELMS